MMLFRQLTRNLFLTLQHTPSEAATVQVSHTLITILQCVHPGSHDTQTESLFLLRRHLGNWPRGPAVSMKNELLVAHEKFGQLPLLTVYVVPCKVRNTFLVNF